MAKQCPIITIDGPGGTGKGTVGQILARELGWHFLDSGVLYRALALAAVKHNVTFDNEPALVILAAHLDIQFITADSEVEPRLIFEGEDVTESIRTEQCGSIASKVSVLRGVREALLERQRAFAEPPGLVTDGRDMGSIVFPNATLKVFLMASCEERARRRHKQLKEKGINANIDTLVHELAERDTRDRQRAVSPLVPAKDAMIIDTTTLSVNDVVDRVLQEVKQRHLVSN